MLEDEWNVTSLVRVLGKTPTQAIMEVVRILLPTSAFCSSQKSKQG
jgi:hypothetical protein